MLLLLLLLQVGLEVVVLCCAIKPLCAWNAETCATTSRCAAAAAAVQPKRICAITSAFYAQVWPQVSRDMHTCHDSGFLCYAKQGYRSVTLRGCSSP
jgi:hypothetical protein